MGGETTPSRAVVSVCSPTMNDRINGILLQMATLEDELRTAVHDQESRMFFQIKGKRIEFERSVKEAHRKHHPREREEREGRGS